MRFNLHSTFRALSVMAFALTGCFGGSPEFVGRYNLTKMEMLDSGLVFEGADLEAATSSFGGPSGNYVEKTI